MKNENEKYSEFGNILFISGVLGSIAEIETHGVPNNLADFVNCEILLATGGLTIAGAVMFYVAGNSPIKIAKSFINEGYELGGYLVDDFKRCKKYKKIKKTMGHSTLKGGVC